MSASLKASRAGARALAAAIGLLAISNPATAGSIGPGLGNMDCGDAEYFQPFGFIANPQGPNGTNVALMIRGYFMTIFAPDSGNPPGEIGIYDVSDPKNPVETRHIENGDTQVFREAHSLPVGLINGRYYIAIQTLRGIQFWDFTDPLNASRVGSIDLPGVNGGDYENVAWQTTWQGRYLYVAGGNLGVLIVDASDPTNPTFIDDVKTGATGGFRVGPLFALGDYMVISNMDQGGAYAVLDISQPEDPALIAQISNLPRIYAIAVGGNDRIYAAGRDGDFLTHSFSDPTNISLIRNEPIGQDQLYAAAQDNFVFLGRQNNVVKVDISNEQRPVVVGEGNLGVDNPDHGQVTPIGNLLFIGNDHGTGSAFFCHQRGPDTIPLTVGATYPKDGSTYVTTQARVNVVLSDHVDIDTIDTSSVAVRPAGGQALDGIYTYSFNTISFGPNEPLEPDTTYELVLTAGGLTDVMGNALAFEVLVRFSTGEQIVIPEPEEPPIDGADGMPSDDMAGPGGGSGGPTLDPVDDGSGGVGPESEVPDVPGGQAADGQAGGGGPNGEPAAGSPGLGVGGSAGVGDLGGSNPGPVVSSPTAVGSAGGDGEAGSGIAAPTTVGAAPSSPAPQAATTVSAPMASNSNPFAVAPTVGELGGPAAVSEGGCAVNGEGGSPRRGWWLGMLGCSLLALRRRRR
jgi:hypothetical protein